MQTNNICIYHKNCADGFAAALVVWQKYGEDCEYIEAQYGDEPPNVIAKNVFIVDFSYPRHVLEQMNQTSNRLIVLDHHKTAKKELENLDYCVFDVNKSGAILTWEYFNPAWEPPKLFKHIQDRDLWQWKLPFSKEISAALRLVKNDFQKWHEYATHESLIIEKLIPAGKIVLMYQERRVSAALERGEFGTIELGGLTVPCVNCTHLISELVGEIAKNSLFAVGYYDTKDKRIFELRSKGEFDVSVIAKKYGGGGHKNAAGFAISKPKIFEDLQ